MTKLKSDYLKNWLVNRMRELDISQRELAKSSGVHETEVSRIIHGVRFPTVDTLKRFAPVLRVDALYILRAAGYIEKPDQTLSADHVGIPIASIFDNSGINVPAKQDHAELHNLNHAEAIVIRGDVMLPFCRDNDVIIFDKMDIPKHGDCVFVKLYSYKPALKKFSVLEHHGICLTSFLPRDSNPPMIVTKKDIEFCYKIIGFALR